MTDNKPTLEKKYEILTQKDSNGDVLIPIPKELISKLKWVEGDSIQFGLDDTGRFILRKVN
jgi:hypothetical protein